MESHPPTDVKESKYVPAVNLYPPYIEILSPLQMLNGASIMLKAELIESIVE